ncbi:MAG: hypothetical protein J6X80_01995 [Lachnospiraceae bacterium]|nr:hypothetical protein [Lachnospiraceae bacterium]
MKKIVEMYKCPNCSGKLEATDDPGIMRCMFCGTEFGVEEAEAEEEEVEEALPKQKMETEDGFTKFEWFDYRTKFKKLINGHDSKDALRTFVYCTNELGTSEAIIKYIKRELIDESGLYCKENKEEKLIAFLNSKTMKGQIKPEDNVIFYANTGIFSSGKHGFVITDKKIVFSGRKPRVIEYSNLRKLAFDTDADFVDVRLNSSYDTSFGTIDGSKKAHGALAALISAFAFENDPKRDKIIVTNFNDDNDDED